MKNFDYLKRTKEAKEKKCTPSDNKNNSLSNTEWAGL